MEASIMAKPNCMEITKKVHNMSLGLKVEKGPEVFGGVELGEVFNQKV
jgi:hypothetical protein